MSGSFETPMDCSLSRPLPMRFPRQESWSRLHFLLQGIFPTQWLNLHLLHWQVDSLPLSHQGAYWSIVNIIKCKPRALRMRCVKIPPKWPEFRRLLDISSLTVIKPEDFWGPWHYRYERKEGLRMDTQCESREFLWVESKVRWFTEKFQSYIYC